MQPNNQQPTAPPVAPQPTQPVVTQVNPSTTATGGGMKKTWILIGFLVSLLIVLGGGAYMLRNSQTPKQTADSDVVKGVQAFQELDKQLKATEKELGVLDEDFATLDADLNSL